MSIPSNVTRFVCTVSSTIDQNQRVVSPSASPNTPETYARPRSLQMTLRWHELPRPSPAPSPSASSMPSALASPS
jgi:hypothetical protein